MIMTYLTLVFVAGLTLAQLFLFAICFLMSLVRLGDKNMEAILWVAAIFVFINETIQNLDRLTELLTTLTATYTGGQLP